MLISNPFAGAFGLDIGDLSLKLIQLERRNGLVRPAYFGVKEARSVSLPPGYIVNGEMQQPEMVRNKLLHLIGKDGGKLRPIKCPYVVADLPEPKTFLKLIEIDAAPADLLPDDVIFNARKHLPFDLEEAYLDWTITNEDEPGAKTSCVLLGAAAKVTADAYTYLMHSVGLTPMALEIEAVSLARALVTADKNYAGEARALLDLGATRSTFIIYDNGCVQFSTTFEFSGELLTTAVAQNLKIDFSAAEELKIKNGLAFNGRHPKYLKTVNGLADELISEIKKALDFYKEHFARGNHVAHITMSGGTANLKNLDDYLSRKLKIGAHPGHPWKNLNNRDFTEKDNRDALADASAIGLALRAISNGTH